MVKRKGQIRNFIESSKANKPTPNTGRNNLPPISDSFMYVETSGIKFESNVSLKY